MKPPVKAETFINSPGRFFHYEPLFTSSFSKNLIIPEAVMISKAKSVTKFSILNKAYPSNVRYGRSKIKGCEIELLIFSKGFQCGFGNTWIIVIEKLTAEFCG